MILIGPLGVHAAIAFLVNTYIQTIYTDVIKEYEKTSSKLCYFAHKIENLHTIKG